MPIKTKSRPAAGPPNDAIILDEFYASALTTAVTSKPGSRTPQVAAKCREALFACLMYGHCYFPSRMWPPPPALLKEGLASVIPKDVYQAKRKRVLDLLLRSSSYFDAAGLGIDDDQLEEIRSDAIYCDDVMLNRVLAVQPFVENHYKRQWRRKAPPMFTHDEHLNKDRTQLELASPLFIGPFEHPEPESLFKELRLSRGRYVAQQLEAELPNPTAILRDEDIETIASQTDIRLLPGWTREEALEQIQAALHREWSNDFELQFNAMRVIASYLRVGEVLDWSARTGSPAKIMFNPTRMMVQGGTPRYIDHTYRVYQITVGEIRCMPIVETLEDVLRLRDDKRIVRFREVLGQWAPIIRGEFHRYERYLRGELRLAARDLEKVGAYRRISDWFAYLAIPLTLIPSLESLGLGLAAIGACFDLRSMQLQRQHEWLLIGNLIA